MGWVYGRWVMRGCQRACGGIYACPASTVFVGAYALHILKNQHEYGPMDDKMTLLKYEQKTPMLIPYEQLYIQTYHRKHIGDT